MPKRRGRRVVKGSVVVDAGCRVMVACVRDLWVFDRRWRSLSCDKVSAAAFILIAVSACCISARGTFDLKWKGCRDGSFVRNPARASNPARGPDGERREGGGGNALICADALGDPSPDPIANTATRRWRCPAAGKPLRLVSQPHPQQRHPVRP